MGDSSQSAAGPHPNPSYPDAGRARVPAEKRRNRENGASRVPSRKPAGGSRISPMRILALLLAVAAGCGPGRLIDGRPRVLAHRGGTGPDGTIAAGERSIALGVEILEM